MTRGCTHFELLTVTLHPRLSHERPLTDFSIYMRNNSIRLTILPGLFALSLCTFAGTQTNDSRLPVALGSKVEMFVDDWLLDRKQNVSLRLQTPIRREIVLTTDKLWEGPNSAYFTVFRDAARVRMYYRGAVPSDNSDQQLTCYAESADGIHFTRPDLGLYEFEGSKQNNIVYRGVEAHNFAPFLDANPNAKAAEKYKALGGVGGRLFAFGSPDGLHWQKLDPHAVMTKGTFDSLNIALWDETAHVYRSYSRYFRGGGYKGHRDIQSCTSRDFIHWDEPRPNAYIIGGSTNLPPLEHFYTSATTLCPGANQIYLAFPKRFVPERTKLAGYSSPGVSDAVFMTSRDGRTWDRRFLEAWVRPGPDPHNWTQRSNMPAWGIVETDPDEFSMYISEHYGWPDHRLRRLSIRRHGFASLHAEASGGECTTRSLILRGSNLVLNYASSAAGSVQVEIQDETGKPIPGFSQHDMMPLFGDELDAVITWQKEKNVASLMGKPVRLRFILQDADIFAVSAK
jgi:hypothetical protein